MHANIPSDAKTIFQSELFTIYTWEQKLYDGSTKAFECCVRPDSAIILAFLDKETLLLTRQEQPQHPHPFFDLPSGRIESNEQAVDAAKRELLEETGYVAGRIQPWFIDEQRGLIHYTMHYFWATDLSLIHETPTIDPGERVHTFIVSPHELKEYCLQDRLRNRVTSLAWLQFCEHPSEQDRLRDFLR